MSTVAPPDDLSRFVTQINTNMATFAFPEAIEAIAENLGEVHEGYFNDQSDPNGIPWKPLAPSTVKRKGHPVILIEYNNMRSSLVNPEHSNHVKRAGPMSLDWGTKDEKAGWHQDGTEHMPQRQFVGWSERPIEFSCNAVADSAVTQLVVGIGTP